MKQPITQLKIVQFLLKNGTYMGSYRDFAEKITGNSLNAANMRRTLMSLVDAGVVSIQSNNKANQHSESKTIISINENWLKD